MIRGAVQLAERGRHLLDGHGRQPGSGHDNTDPHENDYEERSNVRTNVLAEASLQRTTYHGKRRRGQQTGNDR
jgi:hypothetical protein